ncbi:D-beta-hydroxybutyrate dehydrogenase [Magnetospirillum sp. LM-5]|uniref:3-hydroxybutyrate dehydrogenase n=1 Tax=Magnetospirillum sp. LM-5 TaxID=2681466 RepID=UPI001384B4B5|nr:3-hydroxybutyrate dehydrogenase [Magnetospirillum sp. LM-5]CAA7611915.1 D-beta-hydroxybutyrate dehydrogenase [Magnetospirillum sp. LM-5]
MLKGRTAIVTGSTSGIGLGIARSLAAKGADIMLNGFGDAAEIEAIRAGLEAEFKVRALYNGADLAKADQCEALVKDAETRLGRVDILVNNAGIQHVAPIDEFPPERWDAVIAINLSSAFHTIRAALPGMKARGWGRLINVASAHGLVASVNKAAYVAAKHGLIGMTKVVGLECAETGITCNAICPGWVLTPLVQKQIDARAAAQGVSVADAGRDLLSEKQPSKRFTTPEQLGDTAVFLCSDAASNITGTSLAVDGGWTAQ